MNPVSPLKFTNWVEIETLKKIAKNFKISFMAAFAALALSACASTPTTTFYKLNVDGKVDQKTLERLLWENSLSADKDVQADPIVENDLSNSYLVQVRLSEEPHLHEKHDAVAIVQSGRGIMHLKDQSFSVGPGSVIFIPRRLPHYFVNAGKEPAVAFVVFSPGYYGDDYVPVKPLKPLNKIEEMK